MVKMHWPPFSDCTGKVHLVTAVPTVKSHRPEESTIITSPMTELFPLKTSCLLTV